MRCVNPRKLPNPNAKGVEDAYLLVGCNKCYACLSNRRRSWLFRLQNESLNSSMTLFVTFTYSDEYYPYDGCVNKKHLQNFFKYLRQYETFKYYAIGEYGTHTHRAHYHAVIFFKESSRDLVGLAELINELWLFGFTYTSRAHYRRLNYVLHYHTRPKIIDGRQTFHLFSKGLGIDFINPALVSFLLDTGKSVIHDFNGNAYVIPRYYRKKLKDMFISTSAGVCQLPDKEWKMDLHADDEICFRTFGKHIWQLSSQKYLSFLADVREVDNCKLQKYNNQDKLI